MYLYIGKLGIQKELRGSFCFLDITNLAVNSFKPWKFENCPNRWFKRAKEALWV